MPKANMDEWPDWFCKLFLIVIGMVAGIVAGFALRWAFPAAPCWVVFAVCGGALNAGVVGYFCGSDAVRWFNREVRGRL